jgi:hypothetical protein
MKIEKCNNCLYLGRCEEGQEVMGYKPETHETITYKTKDYLLKAIERVNGCETYEPKLPKPAKKGWFKK